MKITKSQFDFIDGYRQHIHREYSHNSPTWKEQMLDDHIDALRNVNKYNPGERVQLFLSEISADKLKEILSVWDNIEDYFIEMEDEHEDYS